MNINGLSVYPGEMKARHCNEPMSTHTKDPEAVIAKLRADKAELLIDIGTVVETLAEAKPIDYKRDCFNSLVILRALIAKHTYPGIAKAMANQWGQLLK